VTLPVEFAGAAETDLEAIADYIGQDNPKRALSFTRELVARCKRIATQPRAFPHAKSSVQASVPLFMAATSFCTPNAMTGW